MTGAGGNVAHLAHLGGMVFGFFMIRYWQRHPSQNYRQTGGSNVFEKMKETFGKYNQTGQQPFEQEPQRESDWDYNAREKREQEEIDRLLDKIRKSGYDSLTRDEKQRLFDQSKKK